MIDIIIKAIDLIKDAVTNKKENRKVLLKDFLEPAMHDIDQVHKNYLETYLTYINSIESQHVPNLQGHPVFQKILSDSISSSDVREKLYSFYDNINDKQLEGFVTSIGHYFRFLSESFSGDISDKEKERFFQPNVNRYNLYLEIEAEFKTQGLTDSERKAQAIKTIQDNIQHLQYSYRRVVDSYNQAKKELL